MAKKAKTENTARSAEVRRCRECACSHDWFSKAHDGTLILGYCPHKKEGKFAILLDDISCPKFTERGNE